MGQVTPEMQAFMGKAGMIPEELRAYLATKEFLSATQPSTAQAIEFPDVSFYQGTIDWVAMSAKTKNIIIRAGQQVWVDEKWTTNWPAAKAHGMRRGCYWFFDGRANPQNQWATLSPLITTDRPETVVWIDWERSYGGAHEGLGNVVALMQLVEQAGFTVGMYTGYYWFIENSNEYDNAAQYDYLVNKPLWLAQYTSGGSSSNLLVPPPWSNISNVELHQWGTPSLGHEYGAESVEIDMNRVLSNHSRYDETIPPPVSDTVTTPYVGVTRTIGRRFNSDIYVTVIDPRQAIFEVAHESPFDNGLFLTSQKCISKLANFGWNGDEWDRGKPLPAYPKNCAYSNGRRYVERISAEPSLNVRRDGTAEIIHKINGLEHNTSTGRRYLIENGVIKDYLHGSEPQYTERHPRGLTGLTHNGKVIMVTVDGRTAASAGVTLLEGAQILSEFGAYVAYDRGGGGDAVDVMDGVVKNIPCDTDADGNPGVERAIPQAILAYTHKENDAMYGYTATSLNEGVRIRTDHNTAAPYVNYYPIGSVFEGDILFTATQDLSNSSGVYQRAGDKWLQVVKVNGAVPVSMSGNPVTQPVWVAIIHMGSAVCSLVENNPEPPPVEEPQPPLRVRIIDEETGEQWKCETFTRMV